VSDPDTLPTGPEKARAVRGMFDRIAGRYDLVNRVMTFGMDVGWRRRAVGELRLPGRSIVADLACGTGDLCTELGVAGYRAVGVDFSHGMLSKTTTFAPLVQADVLRLPFGDGTLDGATCGFALRNVTGLPELFSETSRVLRTGGRISFLEAAEPESSLMRAGHSLYFNRLVPLIGGVLSDRQAYRYLPASMAYLPSGGELVGMLEVAGFVDVERLTMSGGVAQLFVGTRR
jgi:demethylmenaquinone methyltransferase/2-methoxy-6-polyprenyl-1,4-benzoquinol methylase